MVIAAEMRRSYVKRPRQVKVGDFKLKFAFETVGPDGKRILSETEEVLAVKGAKHKRKGWFGGRDIQVVRITEVERDLLRSLPRGEAMKLRREWAADKTRWKERAEADAAAPPDETEFERERRRKYEAWQERRAGRKRRRKLGGEELTENGGS